MANTYAGEVGVTWGERDYLFRPSFAAIASLGDPKHLLSMLSRIQREGMDGYIAALAVLDACHVGDGDLSRLIGYFKEVKSRLRYVLGSMPPSDVHILGARLAVSGMIGEPRVRKGNKDNPAAYFDPAEFVGAAQAHLGVSADEAWDMTMVEFQRAIDAKFPPSEADKAKELPSEAESEAAIAHVMAMRRRIEGSKWPPHAQP